MMFVLSKTTVVVFIIFFITNVIFGQQLSISGVIPGAKSTELRLITYKDYISFKQEILLRTNTDAEGKFEFLTDISETKLVYIEIEHYSFALFVEKEGRYVLQCDTINMKDEYRPLYNKEALPCAVVLEPEPGLNALVSRFNQSYNDFILREFGGIYQKRNTNVINAYRNQITAEYNQYDHSFLNRYITYKLAVVELAVAPQKMPTLFAAYLKDKPILYSHPEYMDFFFNFFDKYIYPDNKFIPRVDLYSSINYQPNYPALIDSLGKDSILRNEVLRELVCLKTLKELYYSKDFSKPNVVVLLNVIEQKSKFIQHREIALNLRTEITHLRKGSIPPPIELPDLDSNMISLSDLKGKPLYINFFTTWSYGCLVELELMKGLYDRYKNDINFLSISLDKNVEIVRSLKQEKDYNWDFVFNGEDYDLLFDYRIKTFPVFLLLDENGKVVEYPAYKPSEVIHKTFDQVLGRK